MNHLKSAECANVSSMRSTKNIGVMIEYKGVVTYRTGTNRVIREIFYNEKHIQLVEKEMVNCCQNLHLDAKGAKCRLTLSS